MSGHVTSGDRTYVSESDSYGYVSRTTFLGLKTISPVIEMDDGTLSGVCGQNAKDKVFNKTSGKNGNDEVVELPIDVREVGPELLGSIGVSEVDRSVLFEKFMALPKDVRQVKLEEWIVSKDDDTLKNDFLTTIVEELADDELYIRAQAHLILNHVEQETRDTMLEKFMLETTEESRKELIIQWQTLKKSKNGRRLFLHSIYDMTLERDGYLQIEFNTILNEHGVSLENQETIVSNYILQTTEEERDEQYIHLKSNYSSNRVRRYTGRWLIRNYQ